MTELEELIEDGTPVNYGEVYRLMDLLGDDLGRLMKSGLVAKSYPLRQVIFRYEETRTLLRKCNNRFYEIVNPKETTDAN